VPFFDQIEVDYEPGTTREVELHDGSTVILKKLEMDYKDYVVQNPKFLRPEELKYLKGDSTKMRNHFGWKPTYSFEALMDDMVEYWNNVVK